uniref:Uncharacterized protein n=1 Tax=Electrophorus electricus TaxID=8005 RepID=A0AAY5EM42_ELEEL
MKARLFFLGLGPTNTKVKPQYTVKTVKHGGAGILKRGCFSYYGVGPIYCIPGIMGQFEYIKILEEVVLNRRLCFTLCLQSFIFVNLYIFYVILTNNLSQVCFSW